MIILPNGDTVSYLYYYVVACPQVEVVKITVLHTVSPPGFHPQGHTTKI